MQTTPFMLNYSRANQAINRYNLVELEAMNRLIAKNLPFKPKSTKLIEVKNESEQRFKDLETKFNDLVKDFAKLSNRLESLENATAKETRNQLAKDFKNNLLTIGQYEAKIKQLKK
jgi:hypothetical protein